MQTGLPTRSTLYSAQETSRRLGHASEGGQGGDEGALLLLPHSAGVQLEGAAPGQRAATVSTSMGGGGQGTSLASVGGVVCCPVVRSRTVGSVGGDCEGQLRAARACSPA